LANKKPTVLIVDDEQMICDVLQRELTEAGYLCVTALTGDDALSKIATQGFEVALLDIKLPGISGIEVLNEIRSKHPGTVAIMITVIDDAKTALEAMKLGASDYIIKPFEPDGVRNSIRTAIESKERSPRRMEKRNVEDWSSPMNAIANAEEARLELLDNHSKVVTERTAEIARWLHIPKREIEKWLAARRKLDAEKHRTMKSFLDKLRGRALALYITTTTVPHWYPVNSIWHQN